VVRLALVLYCLPGCDFVLGISPVEVAPAAACGPFGPAVAVTLNGFGAGLTDFSVSGDGQLATVAVKGASPRAGVPAATDGSAWTYDATRSAGLDATISAHLTLRANDLFGVVRIVQTNLLEVHRFAYAAAWNPLSGPPDSVIASDPQQNVVVGNEVEVGPPPDNITSFATVLIGPDSNGGSYQLRARVKKPALIQSWRDDFEMEMINQAGRPGQGVLTADVFTLVYSSTVRGAPSADLYVAHRDSTGKPFDLGVKLEAPLSTDASDEVEPWIDGTCQTLYFRRRAPGNLNDVGTIFVAHALTPSP
jgi:hypothetical protein